LKTLIPLKATLDYPDTIDCGSKLSLEDFTSLPVTDVKTLSEKILNAELEDTESILEDIAGIESAIDKEFYIQKLSKRLDISKQAIKKELKSLNPIKAETDGIQSEMKADFPGLIDLVVNESGEVAYLIKEDDDLQVETLWDVDDKLYCPPDKIHLPFALPKAEAVIKWYESDSDKGLFEDVITHLKRFSHLSDGQWLIVACQVFLSYIQDHPDVSYLPMLLFWAVPERGKSRTGKAMTHIAYRGIHVVDLREANLFRFSQNLKATLFFDLMDLWKKAERNGAEDILLLRFEKGAKVSRVIYPDKGAFNDTVFYDIYGLTIIATNQPVHKILDTRCIPIIMPNKPGDYENPTPEQAHELKERLTAWRARIINESLPVIELIPGLNGRLWDISKPLLQVCKVLYPQGFEDLKQALLEISGQRLEDKSSSIEGQIVTALKDLSPDDINEWQIPVANVLSKLNEGREDEHRLKSQYIGRKLKAMGLRTRISNGHSIITICRNELNVLLTQFLNIFSDMPEINSPNSPNSPEEGISTLGAGRELYDCFENSLETHPAEPIDTLGFGEFGESGESFHGEEEQIWERCSDCMLLPSQIQYCEVKKPCPRLEEESQEDGQR
jgi:hypothetical protein